MGFDRFWKFARLDNQKFVCSITLLDDFFDVPLASAYNQIYPLDILHKTMKS
jgi:hypothetical protein